MEFLIVFGAGLVLLGIGYVISFARIRSDQQGEANWPVTAGKISSASVHEQSRITPAGSTTTYTPLITYTYVVDGQAYVSEKLDFLPDTTRSFIDRATAEALLTRHAGQEDIKVTYNPHNPGQAVLRTHRPIAHRAVLWFGITLLLLGALVLWLYFVLPF